MKMAAMVVEEEEEDAVAVMMIYQIHREQGQGLVPGVVLMRRTLGVSLLMRRVGLLSERKRRENTSLRIPKGSWLRIFSGLHSTMRNLRRRRRRMKPSLTTAMRRTGP